MRHYINPLIVIMKQPPVCYDEICVNVITEQQEAYNAQTLYSKGHHWAN